MNLDKAFFFLHGRSMYTGGPGGTSRLPPARGKEKSLNELSLADYLEQRRRTIASLHCDRPKLCVVAEGTPRLALPISAFGAVFAATTVIPDKNRRGRPLDRIQT